MFPLPSPQALSGDVVYNVNLEPQRAALIIISQVGEHRVQVTLTLTSTVMRETPPPEQRAGEGGAQ